MARFVIYALITSLVLVPAALLAERAAALCDMPRRWVWAVTLVVLFLLTATAPWRDVSGNLNLDTAVSVAALPAGDSITIRTMAEILRARLGAAVSTLARYDAWFYATWTVASLMVACAYGAGRWRLARRRRLWSTTDVPGGPVLVAPDTGPAVVGLLSPVIVLPQWALALEQRALATVLSHERQHIAAGDAWFVHAAAVATVTMPWNPVVWWIAARLRLAVEVDCDSRVLASDGRTPDAVERYGELLLAVATRGRDVLPRVTAALTEPSSTVSRRIAAMCQSNDRSSRTRGTIAGVAAAAMFVAACGVPAPTAPHDAADAGSAQSASVTPDSGQADAGVYRPGPGIVNPVVLVSSRPEYPSSAMQRKIEGRVAVEAVVDTDGRVARVHVTTPLDPELDARALAAAREWRFQPAQMEGRPVAIAVLLEMEFALR